MNLKGIRWPVAAAVFIACLAIFWGANYLRQKQFVEEPLLQALENMAEVEQVTLGRKGKSLEIRLQVRKLEDYPRFHRMVEEAVSDLYRGHYSLNLDEAPDPAIEAAYGKIHLAVFEAMDRGNYVDMGSYVTETGTHYGLDRCRVEILETHVYLTLENGEAFLYRRFPRKSVGGKILYD